MPNSLDSLFQTGKRPFQDGDNNIGKVENSNLRFQGGAKRTIIEGNGVKGWVKRTSYGVFAILTEKRGLTLTPPQSYGPRNDERDLHTYLEQMIRTKVDFKQEAETHAEVVERQSRKPFTAKEAKILEDMRIDPAITYKQYQDACKAFGQKVQQRPDFNAQPAPVATTPVNPYSAETQVAITNEVLRYFFTTNSLVTAGGRSDLANLNYQKVCNWLRDEGYALPDNNGGMTPGKTVTPEVVLVAAQELFQAGMIHNESAGKRGFKFEIVPYDRARILALRPQQPKAEAPAPARGASRYSEWVTETTVSPYKKAFAVIQTQNPQMNTRSGEFQKLVDELLAKQAAVQSRTGSKTFA
jgi:hypothetical protein